MNPLMQSFAETVVSVARVVGCVTVALVLVFTCALCRVASECSRAEEKRERPRYPKRPM